MMPTPNHPILLKAVDQEVIVIDAALSNDQPLLEALPLSGYVHLLDSAADAITQLAEIVAHYPGLKTLHLISHGESGAIFLGQQTLCLDTLRQHTHLLESLRQSMAPDGEWLIYGCEVAQGDTGRALVAALQTKTGLKIAAASHKVGHTDLGGDWELDVVSAALHSQPLALNEWHGVLNGGPELDLDGFDTPETTSYEVDYMAVIRANAYPGAFFTTDFLETMASRPTSTNIQGLASYGELRISFDKTAFVDNNEETLNLGDGFTNLIWYPATITDQSNTAFTFNSSDDYLYSVSVVGNIATITFKGDGGSLTPGQVEYILDNIHYTNFKEIPPPAGGNRVFTITLTDEQNQNPAQTTFTALFGPQAPAANQAPVLGGTVGTTWTEDNETGTGRWSGPSVLLFNAPTLTDPDSDTDFEGATLTVSLSSYGTGDLISFPPSFVTAKGTVTYAPTPSPGKVSVDGTEVGTVGGGWQSDLTVTFNAAATKTAIEAVMGAMTYAIYSNDDPIAGDRTITATFNDKANANTDTGALTATLTGTLTVVEVNERPTLSGTGSTPTFTQNGSAVGLFSAVTADTVESDQTFSGFRLTVTHVADGADEILTINGTPVPLVDTGANSVSITGGGSAAVTVSGGTATVTITGLALEASAFQTLLEGITYSNASDSPSTTDTRVITLNQVTDSGPSNANSAALTIASTVTVEAVADTTPLTLDLNGPAAGVDRTVNFDPTPNAMTFTTGSNDKNALGGQLVGEHQIETFGKVEIVFNKNHFTGDDSLTLLGSDYNGNPVTVNAIGNLSFPTSQQANVGFTLGSESFGYSLYANTSSEWILVLNTANGTIPMTTDRVELLLDALVYSNTAAPAPTSGTRPFTVKLYEAGNVNPASATFTVDFAPADTTPPVLLSAETSTDGTRIFLTYDELLDATHTAAPGDFSVMVGGVSYTVDSVSVSGPVVVLTLENPIPHGESVAVSYTDPTTGDDPSATQDAAGNDAATFINQPVTNLTRPPLTVDLNGPAEGVNRTIDFNAAADAMRFTEVETTNALGGTLFGGGENPTEWFGELHISFTLADFKNGASESLRLLGSEQAFLTNLGGVTAKDWESLNFGGFNFDVRITVSEGGVATIAFKGVEMAGVTAAQAEAILDSLVYSNTAANPTSGNRVFEIKLFNDKNSDSSSATFTVNIADTTPTPPPTPSVPPTQPTPDPQPEPAPQPQPEPAPQPQPEPAPQPQPEPAPQPIIPPREEWGGFVDEDGDGVPENVEALVPSLDGVTLGDGNGDGIPDNLQSDVSSVPFRNTDQVTFDPNAPVVFVTLAATPVVQETSDGNTQASPAARLRDVVQLDAPENRPDDLIMPLGLISFYADLEAPGLIQNFSLLVDSSAQVNGYWKETPSGTWVNLASEAYGGSFRQVGNKWQLDFVIEDGGIFDDDGLVNGVIFDPGALGYREPTLEPLTPFEGTQANHFFDWMLLG